MFLFTCISGGYWDFMDDEDRSVHLIESLYPPLFTNGIETNSFDSGSDIIHGNAAQDIIFGSGGALGKILSENVSLGQR